MLYVRVVDVAGMYGNLFTCCFCKSSVFLFVDAYVMVVLLKG